MTRRSLPVTTLAALLLLSGVAGCGEDSVYDKGGTSQNNTPPGPVTPNPGLANVGTAPPIPDPSTNPQLGGQEPATGAK
ncbi:MAG TPA: hypothetical protein VMZ00_11165 [Sporichthya sp.]|nr:hypothetical protein [Sporichthya sp.]